MARQALQIEVSGKDRKELRKLLSGGVQQVRVTMRAIALLQMDKGVSAPRVAAGIPLTPQAIRKIGHRYREGAWSGRYMKRTGRAPRLYSTTARSSAS